MRYFSLFFIFAVFLRVSAQEYSFKLFSNKDGVQGGELLSVIQDNKGYLWAGGIFGFNRFDGIAFTNYNVSNGLSDNTVYGINEDVKGQLWLSTSNGISCFDGKNFKNYLNATTNPTIFFNTIETTKYGFLAYGVGGVFKYGNGSFTRIINELDNVRDIVTDKDGNLYIGAKNGLFLYNGKSINSLSINKDLPSKSITCLAFDKDEKLWIGTTKGIACILNNVIIKTYFTEQSASNIIRDVVVSSEYGVVFATDGGDIKFFKDTTFKEVSLRQVLPAGNLLKLAIDKEGLIWIATTGGLIKMYKNDFVKAVLNEKINCPVFGMSYDNNNNLYLGSTNGLYCVKSNETKLFNVGKNPDDNMIISVSTTDSCMYIGSYNGQVYKYKNEKFTPFGDIDLGIANPVYNILAVAPNELWISKSMNVIHYADNKFSINYLARNPETITHSAIKDKKGRVWFANYTNLTFYENGSFKTLGKKEGFDFNSVVTIIEDKFSNIWIGTYGYGIVKYDGKNFTQYSAKQGLINNFLSSSLYDAETNIVWVATTSGVSKIKLNESGEVKSIENFGKAQGLINEECNENSIIKLKNSNILIGTSNGLYEYRNSETNPNKNKPPSLQIKSLKLFYENADFKPFADSINNFNNIPYGLGLPFDKNHLTFDFIGINLSEPEKVKYKWQLLPIDENYSPENSKSNVTYSNLAPNTYTLKIITCGANGIWSSPIKYTFTINPAFYNTWWFYLISICSISILIYLLFYWRINTIKKQQNEKIFQLKKIAEAELKAIRSQLNPHFMFNVLSTIQDVYLDKDEEKAQIFIAEFAALIRALLENSTKKEISLVEEIHFINKYIELEKIRLGDKFEYNIHIDKNIDLSATYIPPMLLQPFIENAITHGLFHKKENGILDINFTKNESCLHISINDNGIGRKASALLKNKLAHSSMAISLITERLDILNTIENKGKYTYSITDLTNETNIAIGTKVEFWLPTTNL